MDIGSDGFFDHTGQASLIFLTRWEIKHYLDCRLCLLRQNFRLSRKQAYDGLSAGKPAQGLAQQFIRTHHNLLLPGVGVNVKHIPQTPLDGAPLV